MFLTCGRQGSRQSGCAQARVSNVSSEGALACRLPFKWAQQGKPLPGFSVNGKLLKDAFENGNPTKETFSKWVVFLQDSDNIPNGARAMPKAGAPSIKAFKTAARLGAPK